LGEKIYILYEFVDPLKTKNIELKIDDFPEADHVDWNVISATPTN
jgi:hypothetical protein